MPIIVAITKFDVVVSQVLLESEDENSQHHERMRTRAYTECEQSYYSLFRNGLENVPLVILSGSCSLFHGVLLSHLSFVYSEITIPRSR